MNNNFCLNSSFLHYIWRIIKTPQNEIFWISIEEIVNFKNTSESNHSKYHVSSFDLDDYEILQ